MTVASVPAARGPAEPGRPTLKTIMPEGPAVDDSRGAALSMTARPRARARCPRTRAGVRRGARAPGCPRAGVPARRGARAPESPGCAGVCRTYPDLPGGHAPADIIVC
jgi:hypothetical protein